MGSLSRIMALKPEKLNSDQLTALQVRPGADRGDDATPDAPRVKRRTDQELEKALENELETMILGYELETDQVRRHHVRRLLKAEEYWKGNQHLVWNERQFRWYTPFEKAVQEAPGSDPNSPRFQYVNNVYRSWGLTILAAITRKLPKVRWLPKSAKAEKDIATAKAASDVMAVIEKNNDIDLLAIRCGYLMWTQGLIGGYVRFVVDSQYGKHKEPTIEQQTVQMAPDRYLCHACATETPEDQITGLAAGLNCPQCNTPLSDSDFHPADYADVPVVTGYKEYPNGQEVISLYGGLHLKMMPTAEKLKDTLYLILCEEMHQAAVRAAHPAMLKDITATMSMSSGDAFERLARLSLADASGGGGGNRSTQPFSKMVTYKRCWLRPEAFYNSDDEEVRNELLQRYPDGVKVILADNKFAEAVAESMDDKWRICRPMPGQGAYTDAVGHDALPIQDQLNDARNVAAEHVEYGSAPPALFDARFIKAEALQNRRMEPASYLPVFPEGAGQAVPLEKMIYQPMLKVDPTIYQYGQEINQFGQGLIGAMPTIFGAPLQGNDTAAGYQMARDQALGKLSLFWRAVKQFWAQMSLISVKCFAANRNEDYELVVEERSQAYASTYIHLEDLQGNVTAEPDTDEDFPNTWAEIRENILQLTKLAPEIAGKYLLHPANAPMLRKFIGNPQMVMPDEDDEEKQYREIDLLLKSEPIMPPMNPATGQPVGHPEPTIQPELFADNHNIHIQILRSFVTGDKGLEAKRQNPGGYANCLAHLMAHIMAPTKEQLIQQQLMAQIMPPPPPVQPAAGSAGPGAGPQKTVGDAVEEALPGVGEAVQKLAGTPVQ